MTAVLRTWLGFLALGAGLVHVALVIGSPLPVALVLLLIGAAEFTWGVFSFARTTPPLPMLARSAALVPVIGWALLLVVAGADSFGPLTSPGLLLPMLVASFFDLLIAGILTGMLRRAAREAATPSGPEPAFASSPAPEAAPHPVGSLVGVILGALVIAALTMPALLATEAGQSAQPHTTGTITFPTGRHEH